MAFFQATQEAFQSLVDSMRETRHLLTYEDAMRCRDLFLDMSEKMKVLADEVIADKEQ